MASERLHIRSLAAGQTIEYFQDRIGQPATFRVRYKTVTYHRFTLAEADVIALVRDSDNTVASYSVYLKTEGAKVDVDIGGNQVVHLGQDTFADVSSQSSVFAAGGYCGGLRSNYSELSGGSAADHYQYVVATGTDEFLPLLDHDHLCPLTAMPGCDADTSDFTQLMSRSCTVDEGTGVTSVERVRSTLRPNALSVVAPGIGFTGYMSLTPGDIEGLAARGWKPSVPPSIPRLSDIDLLD